MRKLISCEFNMHTACVELRYTDGTLISIDCTEVEYQVAHTVKQRSALDYLIYNAPLEYKQQIVDEQKQKGKSHSHSYENEL